MKQRKFDISVLQQLEVGRLGNRCYLYDDSNSTLKQIPAHEIPVQLFESLNSLLIASKAQAIIHEQDLLRLLDGDKEVLQELQRAGYIHSEQTSKQSSKKKISSFEIKGYFAKPTFFNVPESYPQNEADVAIVGIPLACKYINQGVATAPAMLRAQTTRSLNWFKIFENGVYSEMNMNGKPRSLARGVVPKDFGDLDESLGNLENLDLQLQKFWSKTKKNDLRPIFVGGDHSITLPILLALAKVNPKVVEGLTLIHLDAHNDCMGEESIYFNHAAVIISLLELTPIKKVISFGLRTDSDVGMKQPLERMRPYHKNGRLLQFGIQETRQIFESPERFRALVGKSASAYFTFDIDFLCSQIVEGAVWTSMPGGGAWQDVFKCVELIHAHCDLIGCDLVEYNPMGLRATEALTSLSNLLLLLVDRLGHAKTKSV